MLFHSPSATPFFRARGTRLRHALPAESVAAVPLDGGAAGRGTRRAIRRRLRSPTVDITTTTEGLIPGFALSPAHALGTPDKEAAVWVTMPRLQGIAIALGHLLLIDRPESEPILRLRATPSS